MSEASFQSDFRAPPEFMEQLRQIHDKRVLNAMSRIPRHEFVPESICEHAYNDAALPIGWDQTISQPFIVAFMTEQLHLKPTDTVLEVGTGSGYQTAILSLLAQKIYTVEIIEPLARRTWKIFDRLGFQNIEAKIGDGHAGWQEHAPFDAIIVTCAAHELPPALEKQLKTGGKLIMPIGPSRNQHLYLLEKEKNKIHWRNVLSVRFVPMTGEKKEDV